MHVKEKQSVVWRDRAPMLAEFASDVARIYPMFTRTLAGYLDELTAKGPAYFTRAESLVGLARRLSERMGLSRDDLYDAYAEFCITFLKEQQMFLETGKYSGQDKGFEKVREEVYENDEYMTHYMLGHLLSCAVFPHHFEQYRFFCDSFVPAVAPNGVCSEMGMGHGMWIGTLLADYPGRRARAYDVSPLCIRMAAQTLDLLGVRNRCELVHADVIQAPLAPDVCDGIIAAGLLEHLEDPASFLEKIKPLLRVETGRLFIMVPTNTAHPDHLVLFESVDEIRALFRNAGLATCDERAVSVSVPAGAAPPERESIVYLAVLKRPAGHA